MRACRRSDWMESSCNRAGSRVKASALLARSWRDELHPVLFGGRLVLGEFAFVDRPLQQQP